MKKIIDVVMLTYNHENFIRQAVESVLMQVGDFELRLLVFDDASTDSTAKIVADLAQNDPRVQLVINPFNLGFAKNFEYAVGFVKAEYFAFCEGDDYWIFNQKLQKQMLLLEENPELVMCYNNLICYNEGTKIYSPNAQQQELKKSVLGTEDMILNYTIKNFSTCFYRNILDKIHKGIYGVTMGDWIFHIEVSRHGKIGVLEEPMSVYRWHPNSVWTSLSIIEKLEIHLKIDYEYDELYKGEFHNLFMKDIAKVERFLAEKRLEEATIKCP